MNFGVEKLTADYLLHDKFITDWSMGTGSSFLPLLRADVQPTSGPQCHM